MLITTSVATAYLSTSLECQQAPVAGLVDQEPPVASCPPQRCDDSQERLLLQAPQAWVPTL